MSAVATRNATRGERRARVAVHGMGTRLAIRPGAEPAEPAEIMRRIAMAKEYAPQDLARRVFVLAASGIAVVIAASTLMIFTGP